MSKRRRGRRRKMTSRRRKFIFGKHLLRALAPAACEAPPTQVDVSISFPDFVLRVWLRLALRSGETDGR